MPHTDPARIQDPAARAAAYRHCRDLARAHYENFPVASLALPRRLREAVAVIYAFARGADDLADEGDLAPETRLILLRRYGSGLDAALAGQTVPDPVLMASADVIAHHGLPAALFHDLLTAFRMDVTRRRYASYAEVLDYCRYSANPVGRLLLHLVGAADPPRVAASDQICTALQLINFLQDIDQDYRERDRIYLPADDMARHGVTERQLRERRSDARLRALLSEQRARARARLRAGAHLGRTLSGPMALEVRMILAGGFRILDLLAARREDLFTRPRLGARDRLALLWRALSGRLEASRGNAPPPTRHGD